MREVVSRRYRRLQEEKKPLPSLILIDGGIGQLHAAAQALDSLQIINQPLASIAKKEEILYVFGQENEPIILERHSPVLHLIQQFATKPIASPSHFIASAAKQNKQILRCSKFPASAQEPAEPSARYGSIANVQPRRESNQQSHPAKAPKKLSRILARNPDNDLADYRLLYWPHFLLLVASYANFLSAATIQLLTEVPMADNVGSKVTYFLVGLGVGALVGILFAPKSGEETREFLSKNADEGRDYAQRKARELRERADELIERGKDVAARQEGIDFRSRRRRAGSVPPRIEILSLGS